MYYCGTKHENISFLAQIKNIKNEFITRRKLCFNYILLLHYTLPEEEFDSRYFIVFH